MSSNSCGIHSIAVSPLSHYVSTCGQNPSELAVYKHHTLDPLILGRVCCKSVVYTPSICCLTKASLYTVA